MSRKKWTDLDKPPLSEPVLEVVKTMGFDLMTPVQTTAIPLLLSHKDVSAQAVTGSGKTLAFLVPLIEILQKRHHQTPWSKKEIGALVISPTRELAVQIFDVLKQFLLHERLNHLRQKLIVGGNNIEDDIKSIQSDGPCIMVCTPGRLEDLFQRKSDINLASRVKSLEFLVLDEADRLLDLGFQTTINNILNYLPRQRRTGLFSATQTNDLTDLIRAGLRNPVLITIKEKTAINTPLLLQNFYSILEADEKFLALLSFLKSPKVIASKIMIFFPTCACIEYWSTVMPYFLPNRSIFSIHGKMKNKRKNVVERFRMAPTAILLCTDVLARGLDVPEIHWVVQWDPPSNAASFVHRVGRTARQGHAGSSLIFLLPNEDAYVTFLNINQKVQMDPLKDLIQYNRHDLTDILQTLYELQLNDKAVYEKAMRAFVSDIRAYTKHECNAILRLKDKDLGKAATGYGLLKMPRMPELKSHHIDSFVGPQFEIDFTKLIYKNKQKEEVRQQKLKAYKETGQWPVNKKITKRAESWELSKKAKLEAKSKKEMRKVKKQKKKEAQSNNATNTGSRKKKRKVPFTQEDLEELANDLRLFKKLKKNKISEEDFNKEIGIVEE